MMSTYLVVLLGDDRLPMRNRHTLRIVTAENPEHAAAVAHPIPPDNASYALVTEIRGRPVTVGVRKSAAWDGIVGAGAVTAATRRDEGEVV